MGGVCILCRSVVPVVWINAIVGAWFALLGAVSLGTADVPLKGL